MKAQLKKRLYANPITRRLCHWRSRAKERFALVFPIYKTKLFHPKTVFFVLTPEHANIGDHAITNAEQLLLNQMHISYMEITSRTVQQLRRFHALHVFNGSPILVNGGGNLGTLWYEVEEPFREIIQQNPRSPIILFPNTFFYEDTDWGRQELEKSIEIYNAHPKLTLFAREKTSYEAMKKIYRDVRLVPDMVLTLQPELPESERSGCLVCLRKDLEKTLASENEQRLLESVYRIFGSAVTLTDMVEDRPIPVAERNAVLDRKFRQFASAEVVLTDRLHAMIFSAITGTPCVVVDSKSPKLRGVYAWIKDLPYIQFADGIQEAAPLLQSLRSKESHTFNGEKLQSHFQELVAVLADFGGK